jgi:RNA polymerase subunit RPABC4/transcription elongation factor Spt4
MTDKPKYCSQCGTRLNKKDKFCPECGKRLIVTEESQDELKIVKDNSKVSTFEIIDETVEKQVEESIPQSKFSFGNDIIIIGGISALAACLLVFLLAFFVAPFDITIYRLLIFVTIFITLFIAFFYFGRFVNLRKKIKIIKKEKIVRKSVKHIMAVSFIIFLIAVVVGFIFIDFDGDDLSNLDEILTYHTDALNSDTDGDGLSDGKEIELGSDIFDVDSDNDGIEDGSDSNPTVHDWKLMDSDNDGWSDYKEYYEMGTDRFNEDTDGDGAPDAFDEHPLSISRLMIRSFEWDYPTFFGKTYSCEINVSYDLYLFESKNDRNYGLSQYVQYTIDPTSEKIANELSKIADEEGFHYYETVNFVLAFVHDLPYTSDDATIGADEYPRYPTETIIDGGGDCEDSSILVASILKKMNYDTCLVYVPGHMAVAVYGHSNYPGTWYTKSGKHYFICESTGGAWEMGEIPPSYSDAKASLYNVKVENPKTPPEPARFETSDLVVTPSTVTATNPVTISVSVSNKGDLKGSHTVTLKINNDVIESQEVTVDGKSSITVTFTATKVVPDTYNVNVEGLTGTFTISLPSGWTTYKIFSGADSETSDIFTLPGPSFRVYYKVEPRTWGYFVYYLYRVETSWYFDYQNIPASTYNSGYYTYYEEFYNFYNYYVRTDTANVDWTILIAVPTI